jgi:hypothetical protein
VSDFFKTYSGNHASPPALLDIVNNEPGDLPTFQEEMLPPPEIETSFQISCFFMLFMREDTYFSLVINYLDPPSPI